MLTLTGHGRLTCDIQLRTTRSGKAVATISVASDRRDRDTPPIYVDLIVWDAQAKAAAQHLVKGQAISFAGRFEPREYATNSGDQRVALELHFVDIEYRAKPRSLPPDDPSRHLPFANPDDPGLTYVAVVGDTYTILVTGEQTDGRYALIDMLVPPGGGPPPHRHDFEEMFDVLEGSVEVTFRGETMSADAGDAVNVPAGALHAFRNAGDVSARPLCVVAPAGLERFIAEIGDPVAQRTSPPPDLDEAQRAERMRRAIALAPKYGMEVLPPA